MLSEENLMNILMGAVMFFLAVTIITLAVWNWRSVYRKVPRSRRWRVARQLNKALQLVDLALDNLRYGPEEGRPQHALRLREGLNELNQALAEKEALHGTDQNLWTEARSTATRVHAAMLMGSDNRVLNSLFEAAQRAVDRASDRAIQVLAREEEVRNVA
jgi:hypothetical protein